MTATIQDLDDAFEAARMAALNRTPMPPTSLVTNSPTVATHLRLGYLTGMLMVVHGFAEVEVDPEDIAAQMRQTIAELGGDA